MINIEGIDLLSLSIFVLLYESESATVVSRQMNIPAPKISRCLKSLREAFNNELFIRRRYGMCPNMVADQIYPIAKNIVASANEFNKVNINSSETNNQFAIALPDCFACSLTKDLMTRLKKVNEKYNLILEQWHINSWQDVINEKLSFSLCCHSSVHELESLSDKLEVIPLVELNQLYLLSPANHPILGQEISLETIANYPYVVTEFAKLEDLTPYQRFCQRQGIELKMDITIRNASSLIDYMYSHSCLALTSYKTLYDKYSQIAGLHACQLSKVEAARLHQDQAAPWLFLLKRRDLQDPKLAQLITTLSDVVKEHLE
ncbi:LysR family transcriptional regulator [Shewanella sp. NIFS-20-20]|uniref:LysR family transcriptional regulator n=1 Tax=Shewanella sp. NIFS-20-20 TaxID=2853806 RepID=UPI001C453FA3|nr:LysR family transcriptional regulator [Shewanella sp. NIFS-20-20]